MNNTEGPYFTDPLCEVFDQFCTNEIKIYK